MGSRGSHTRLRSDSSPSTAGRAKRDPGIKGGPGRIRSGHSHHAPLPSILLSFAGRLDYELRSIETGRPSGSFRTWNSGTYAHLPEKQQLPVYSRRLREAREAHGISQRGLGIAAGLDEFVASTRVNRYETGVHQPDLQTLQRLAKVLGLPVAYFYAEDDELALLVKEFKGTGKRKR
jgi:DNA-binding XRE family transcriptional regulator